MDNNCEVSMKLCIILASLIYPPPPMGSRSQAGWAKLPYKDGAASAAPCQKLAVLWCQPILLYPLVANWFAEWLPCTAVYTCTLIVQSVLLNSAQAELSNTVNFIGCNFKQELLNCPLWISQNQKV